MVQVIDIRDFAILHHQNSYAGGPYSVHLDDVWDTLREFGFTSSDWRVMAYGHDLLEDTNVAVEDLKSMYGRYTANVIDAVSGYGPNRNSRLHNIYAKIANSKDACILKSADRISNMRSAMTNSPKHLAMYRKEREFLRIVKSKIPVPMYEELLRLYGG